MLRNNWKINLCLKILANNDTFCDEFAYTINYLFLFLRKYMTTIRNWIIRFTNDDEYEGVDPTQHKGS